MKEEIFNIISVIRGTTVDGPGLRTSIYFAGCSHYCKGCHNPETWDAKGGIKLTVSELISIIKEEDFNVTLSGGDPLFYPDKLLSLVKEIKKLEKNIWLYTGYKWEEIIKSTSLLNVVREVDYVVDGKFILELKDADLKFKGSSNQRIINVRDSIKKGEIILYD